MLTFNDLLAKEGIDPRDVNVILHSPREREFAKVLPSLLITRPSALAAYQSSHNRPAERSLKKGRGHMASFVKTGEGRLVFAGLYLNEGWQERKMGDIWQEPEIKFLHETYGVDYGRGREDPERPRAWFDFRLIDALADLQGRLLIGAKLAQNYVRLCESLNPPVLAILEEGVFVNPAPDWNKLTVSGAMVRALPPGWAASLREWRGVYLIVDESDGARYVGSAYGDTKLFGRWREHVAKDRGITKELAKRNPVNFRFSILQLLAPDAEAGEVIRLEHGWMDRLHTREFGLNA